MSRRKVKYPTVTTPWREEMREIFAPLDKLFGDAAPPGNLRVYHGARHYTVKATFTRRDGSRLTATARLPRPPA